MPESPKSIDLQRRQSLAGALDSAGRALQSSGLPHQELRLLESQISTLATISKIVRPDWGHIESLVKRLLWRLGDRVPTASVKLRTWTEENATRYRTLAGNWRMDKDHNATERQDRSGAGATKRRKRHSPSQGSSEAEG